MTDLGELNRCRLCSSENGLTDVFSAPNKDKLLQMIAECTSIRITFEMDFPCVVCSCCIRIVNQFFTYRQKCLDYNCELNRLRGMKEPLLVEEADSKDKSGSNHKFEAFYEDVQKRIQEYLVIQVKEIERKAMDKVKEELQGLDVGQGEHKVECVTVDTVEIGKEGDIISERNSDADSADEDDSLSISVEKPKDPSDTPKGRVSKFKNHAKCTAKDNPAKKLRSSSPFSQISSEASEDQQETSAEEKLAEARRKINSLMKQNYRLELNQLRRESRGPAEPFRNYKSNFVDPKVIEKINAECPVGLEGDGKFISALADQLWTRDQLAARSVRGKQCYRHPESSTHIPASPTKVSFIHDKLMQRINLEEREDDDPRRKLQSRVSHKLNEKFKNARRLKEKKQSRKR
ncbi:uncharacterized protein LOC110681507 isoform X2 [Aedes aegypti]|uniref:Uncharacterized protein n=1 Tax=Aedes aegypti TaxID=7159 RepID=A0A6I8TUG5_AEDAE|nr:uncharacterized protein LOC110681507 isoform X2 [Aedes aegypti]